jgi:hypothetical protein
VQQQRQHAIALPTNKPTPSGHSLLVLVTFSVLLVFEVTLATLSGTYLAPTGSLNCGLEETWLRLFQAKDSRAVRRIQDDFDCCGLRSTRDRAWPFPGQDNTVDSCWQRFQRDRSCLTSWRSEEQRIAGLLVLVTVLTFVWKVSGNRD